MCSLQRLRSTCAPFRSWASSLLLAVGSTPDLPRRPRGLCLYPALCHSLHLVAHTLRLLRRRPIAYRRPPPAPPPRHPAIPPRARPGKNPRVHVELLPSGQIAEWPPSRRDGSARAACLPAVQGEMVL